MENNRDDMKEEGPVKHVLKERDKDANASRREIR
jgi:hypothetical protein